MAAARPTLDGVAAFAANTGAYQGVLQGSLATLRRHGWDDAGKAPRCPPVWLADYADAAAVAPLVEGLDTAAAKAASTEAMKAFLADPTDAAATNAARDATFAAVLALDRRHPGTDVVSVDDADHVTACQVYSNRSLLHLKTGQPRLALLDAVRATVHDARGYKPHLRGLLAAKAADDILLATEFAAQGWQRGGGADESFRVAAKPLLDMAEATAVDPSMDPRKHAAAAAAPPPDPAKQLEPSLVLLQHVWANELDWLPEHWLEDYLTRPVDIKTSKEELSLLASKTPAELKNLGNDAWRDFTSSGDAGKSAAAKLRYMSALAKLDIANKNRDAEAIPEEDRLTACQVYSNRSLLHLKTGQPLLALLDAVRATVHDARGFKPHLRGLLAAQANDNLPLAMQFTRYGMKRGGGDDAGFADAARQLLAEHKKRVAAARAKDEAAKADA